MPDWKPEILRRLALLKLAPTREAEIAEELSQHLDDRYQEFIAGGQSEDAAFRAALEELKGEDLLARSIKRVEKNFYREPIALGAVSNNFFSSILQDIRYSFRMLRKSPGFTAVAILTLALGIGANTAIFSVFDAVLLKTLPVEDLYSRLLSRIQALPGVNSASLLQTIPLSGGSNNTNITVEGSPRKVPDSENHLRWLTVGPDFFRTMQIPIILGRGITEADVSASRHVAVVDQTFVRTYLGDAYPIGRHFYLGGGGKPDPDFTFEIIGVVKPAELTDVHAEPIPKAYMQYAQFLQLIGGELYFVVRTHADPKALLPEMRDAVRGIDPNLPLTDVDTQTELTADALMQERLFARLSSFFGSLALLLAMIGLYGIMAYSVTRKTHEIGIRMALGAKPGDVLRMVTRQGITLTVIGVVIGIAAALGVTRLVSSMIYGVTATDPVTFATVAIILVGVALLASYIPARRAMRVDPMIALRHE